MIEITAAAALNTVQDAGRTGQRRFGIGSSGAMDGLALRVGNILLGNQDNAAGIEVQVFPFAVRFARACGFAVTGADCKTSLDGAALPPWWATVAQAGQVLRLEGPEAGARSYLTVAGGIDVPVLLGSRSTHLRAGFGGLDGRALRDGDKLETGEASCPGSFTFGVDGPVRNAEQTIEVRALPAAEHDDFPRAAQESFWSSVWQISAQSNRHGYRLLGPKIEGAAAFDLRSSPIMPGVIQVPPNGHPIVQMSDANSAGGYPKLATVISADLPQLGQARLGSHVRFRSVHYDVAVDAERTQAEYLSRVRGLVALWRRQAGLINATH